MEELQAGDPPQVGPYLLLGRLGAGGMGQVFLGRSPGGRLVAVKVIRAELAGDPGFRARFAREVAAARKVSGMFTAPVVDADPAASLPWLVTGFVNALSLAEAVNDHGALPVASVLALAAGLAEGLGAVHAAGVVHRDLKPSNVLLAPDGPRLFDFGISQAVDATHLTRTGMVIGSPAFMSPEQVEGAAVGPASDVFSLGAVLVFAATSQGPFGTGTPTALLYRVVHGTPRLDQLPGPVRALAGRCLAKDPGQRPTARQFLAELTAAYPSAADLTDWLPGSILSAVASLRPATGHAPGPAAGATGQPGMGVADLAGSPTWPPTAAASSPPAPDAASIPTLTAASDHDRPGSASPAEQQAADMVRPTHSAGAHEEPDTSPVSATTVSWDSSGPGSPAAEAVSPPQPAGTAGTAARNRRRRRWAVSGIAAVAVLGVIAGLIIAAPRKPPPAPPVLRPTGLTADFSTISSVAFRWSGPATGPAPDKYEIVQDGQLVGSVPGNITYYQDAGLAPDTSYRFQVIAIRNGQRSPQSVVLSITTLTPPVSAAVLNGPWTVNEKTISANPPDPTGIGKVGATWTDSWAFTPDCAVGACNVTLKGTFDRSYFTASLTRAGAIYTGTAALDRFSYCVNPSNYNHDTMHFQIQVQGADVQGSAWTASSWVGTVTLDEPYVPVGNCYADTFKISVVGSA